jgi:hypothetical protein
MPRTRFSGHFAVSGMGGKRTLRPGDDDAGQCGFDDEVEHGLPIVPAVQERQSQRGTHRYDCESRPNPSHAAHFSPIGPFVDSAPGEAFN